MKTLRMGNKKGQSLVQVLVSMGIMGIFMMAMISTQSMQAKENRALSEKLAANDFQQQLTRAFADGSLCKKLLTTPSPTTFDSTKPTKNLPFASIPGSVPFSWDFMLVRTPQTRS